MTNALYVTIHNWIMVNTESGYTIYYLHNILLWKEKSDSNFHVLPVGTNWLEIQKNYFKNPEFTHTTNNFRTCNGMKVES